jgi:hypothetical protein
VGARAQEPRRYDSRYENDGGWKVHLTVGAEAYERRVAAIKRWLRAYFGENGRKAWKHLNGGDKHAKDFTVYLGSYSTMISFVDRLESSQICGDLGPSNAGAADRVVGLTGKCAARFDPRGNTAGRDWFYGWHGIPFKEQDAIRRLGKAPPEPLADVRKEELRQLFGEYFLPDGVE